MKIEKETIVPNPVKWNLVIEAEKDKSIKLTKSESFLIRHNLKQIWNGFKRDEKLFNKTSLLRPVSKRLHLDFTLVVQGSDEVLLCRSRRIFKH